jgi:hypothetical protein
MTGAHVSQHMQHAQMGDEAGWRPHASGLEGRHDELKQRHVPPARPAVAVPLRRWPSAPNVKDLDLATRLQLVRVELLTPDLDGGTAACVVCAAVLVREDGVDGCGVGACRRSDLRKSVTNSQIHVSYACRQS